MTDDPSVLSSLPDAPLTRDVIDSLTDADAVRHASPVLVRGPGGPDGPNEDHAEDVLLATGERIWYLSLEPDEGWSVEHDATYEDGEFEDALDDVRYEASKHAEAKYQEETEFEI
ncbi:hypothetical protein SAMN06269185_2110 [Natronoarchaeum philippinense]|uniref:DUF7964 domain-containing protein n=1 Tax=Natronoarchaeum philippinense TaxID=558529 RepID=A0A285P091_NATPI|nr:hypothetical protein [Natronoarchaeum philippinense]SNZ13301.1 hypothetical protein SAMN06269185_2110 [Natronoarchaeum philippinense]